MNDSPPDDRLPRPVLRVISVLVLAATVMILNETTLNVALPSIMEDFSIPATTAQWLTTGFVLVLATIIPTSGWLIERLSTRTMFFTAFALFLLGTVVAGLAPSFVVLLLGRMLQAAGTAVIFPLLMTTVMTIVPPHKMGAVMGFIPVVISVAPALGPTVSGLILKTFSWHYIFWFMVPVAALVVLLGLMWISNVGDNTRKPLDVVSVPISAVGFGGLVYFLSNIDSVLHGRGTTAIAIGVVAVLALVLFVRRQRMLARQDKALLDFRVFQYQGYGLGLSIILVHFGIYLGIVTVFPIYIQNSLLLSTVISGLVVMPGGIVQAIASPFVGRAFDKLGARSLVIPGTILTLLSVALMTVVITGNWFTPSTTAGVLAGIFSFTALGGALTMTPAMTAALSATPMTLRSHGSAVFNTLQQLAGAAGIAILVAIMTQGMTIAGTNAAHEATRMGTALALGFALCLSVVMVGLALRFRPAAPAESSH